MSTLRRVSFSAILLILATGGAHGQDEYTLAQQGFLTKPGGQPVDSMLSMTFKLYKGGAEVWSETHPSIQVTGGNYEVPLGSVTPFDTVKFDVPIDLGIKIGTDVEMNPRVPLRASPRALTLQNLRVHRVDGALGLTVNLIGGRENNSMASDVGSATISGGGTASSPNQVNANGGTVGGGWGNQVDGPSGTVAGGRENLAQASGTTVGGGASNEAQGSSSTISGGWLNIASGDYASIGGGWDNAVSGDRSTVGGGVENAASALAATVGGGQSNTASGDQSTVGGGGLNSATMSSATVGGGLSNIAHLGGTVGGGIFNTADGDYSTVAGGDHDWASGDYSFIGGGNSNAASAQYATVTGGQDNLAAGEAASVAGGNENHAAGAGSTVAGGWENQATGSVSTVAGGWLNAARGYASFAAGFNAKAKHDGSFVWGDRSTGLASDSLVTTANNQFLIRAAGGVGIGENNTFAPLHVTNQNIGLSASDVYQEDLIVEASDAVIGLYSHPGDTWGSGINLIEMTSCGVLPCFPLPEFENAWSIVRSTSGGGNDLYFRFGANTNYGLNAAKLVIRDNGNLEVVGALSKGSGSFKIDHPLDPENKYLYHSFVESPDMMNVYNGNVMLDASGEATVEMPAYFEALNRDFRYQLTCIGGFAPVYVAEEIANGSFRIAGGSPGMKVSWLVTGIRKDPYAEMHPIEVEIEKPVAERGTYLHPEAYGRSATESLVSSQ